MQIYSKQTKLMKIKFYAYVEVLHDYETIQKMMPQFSVEQL